MIECRPERIHGACLSVTTLIECRPERIHGACLSVTTLKFPRKHTRIHIIRVILDTCIVWLYHIVREHYTPSSGLRVF